MEFEYTANGDYDSRDLTFEWELEWPDWEPDTVIVQLSGQPTFLIVDPSPITIPSYDVEFSVGTPVIWVHFEYYYEGNGPYYTPVYETDQQGRFYLDYTYQHLSAVGTYHFTKIGNAELEDWNDIDVEVELLPPDPLPGQARALLKSGLISTSVFPQQREAKVATVTPLTGRQHDD